ncbi:hypothetical protein BDF21DRAFT_154318 [Thamnidium elegans]|uniref:CHCH domain-containing protein n=1 Tax=Thamnidium elegans TaxID=101142 RepID=A0A8H7SX66_9FUNG|nr:hypothetical protein INT48_006603 [Thamnidium elegans]KAI8092067.1 hypothetical protein BDF21DRAFT_154318 [Thamnidium elegans]
MARSRQTRRAPAQQQTRSAHTMPTRQAPRQQQHAPVPHQASPPAVAQQQPRQPGMFAQMATTAAGVAVGSAVGHTMASGVSSMFGGGGSSSEPQQQQQQEPYQEYQQPMAGSTQNGASCESNAKAFTQCLEATNNDMSACQYYLDALKQCQSMASQY